MNVADFNSLDLVKMRIYAKLSNENLFLLQSPFYGTLTMLKLRHKREKEFSDE